MFGFSSSPLSAFHHDPMVTPSCPGTRRPDVLALYPLTERDPQASSLVLHYMSISCIFKRPEWSLEELRLQDYRDSKWTLSEFSAIPTRDPSPLNSSCNKPTGIINRRPTEYELKELTKQISSQREQLHCIERLVMEKGAKVTGLQAGIEMLESWVKTTHKAQERTAEISKLYTEVDSSIVEEMAVENRAQLEQPDLATRIQLGEKNGELLSTLNQLGSVQAKLTGIFTQRTHRLQLELDATRSLFHFAKIDLDALIVNREAVQTSLDAKSFFLFHINSLSAEVLCRIFGLVVDEELHDRKNEMMDNNQSFNYLKMVNAPLRLGAVSREWRRIVDSYPPLWRGIVVNFRGAATAFAEPNSNVKDQRQLQQIEYYLSHNQGVDLDLLVYVSTGTYEHSFLASVASRFQPRVVRQIIIRAQHLSLQFGLDHASGHPTLNQFLARLPAAKILNITPWKRTGEQGATDPKFFLNPDWLGECQSFTSFGLHPLLPMHRAPSVQRLSITRTSCNPGWNLAAILEGFPNLTHLEIDPTLKGHTSSLELLSPPLALTLNYLTHITASATGLDDLNKLVNNLKLPSLRHLTLLSPSSSLQLSALSWAGFIGGTYSSGLTSLEFVQSPGPLVAIHQLTALHTLILHGGAIRSGLETLVSHNGNSLPPNLKDIYLYGSDINISVIRTIESQLIERTEKPIRFHPMFSALPATGEVESLLQRTIR